MPRLTDLSAPLRRADEAPPVLGRRIAGYDHPGVGTGADAGSRDLAGIALAEPRAP